MRCESTQNFAQPYPYVCVSVCRLFFCIFGSLHDFRLVVSPKPYSTHRSYSSDICTHRALAVINMKLCVGCEIEQQRLDSRVTCISVEHKYSLFHRESILREAVCFGICRQRTDV